MDTTVLASTIKPDTTSPDSLSPDSTWPDKLALARGGDRVSLGEMLNEFWQPLWAHAKLTLDKNVQPKQAASDIVQETFVEAHNAISGFRGSSRREFYGWLRTILNNNIRDAWRHHAGTQKRDIDLERSIYADNSEKQLKADGTGPIDRVLRDERDSFIEHILVQLPEHYRLVIRLRYWETMSFEQIGKVLDKSPDAVRQVWYRAIESFTDLMERHEQLPR